MHLKILLLDLMVASTFFIVTGCHVRSTSATKGVIDLSSPLPVSNKISVCWRDLKESQLNCKKDLQAALIKEFHEKTDLELRFRDTCMSDENVEIRYQDTQHVNSYIEGEGRSYSLMEIICEDFSHAEAIEIRTQCRSAEEAKKCNVNIGVHEFGHAIGLSHEDLRPESPTGSPVYDDDEFIVLSEFDHRSIMHFGYYKNLVGKQIIELTEKDISTINKLYRQDLMLNKKECTERYRYDEASMRCFIKPTNGM